jgi:hypothetical protein
MLRFGLRARGDLRLELRHALLQRLELGRSAGSLPTAPARARRQAAPAIRERKPAHVTLPIHRES